MGLRRSGAVVVALAATLSGAAGCSDSCTSTSAGFAADAVGDDSPNSALETWLNSDESGDAPADDWVLEDEGVFTNHGWEVEVAHLPSDTYAVGSATHCG